MISITDPHETMSALDRAVNVKGSSYVYKRLDSWNAGCSNTEVDPETGERVPSCIVGHVLADLLGGVELIPAEGAFRSTFETMEFDGVTFDPVSKVILGVAQQIQDSERTWGEALRAARAALCAILSINRNGEVL